MIKKASYNESHIIAEMAIQMYNTHTIDNLELDIKENHRCNGYAKELLLSCERQAQEMGCIEFASDCELNNIDSLKFHLAMGFAEANRIICFQKRI